MTSLLGSGGTERAQGTKNDPENPSAALSEGSPLVSAQRAPLLMIPFQGIVQVVRRSMLPLGKDSLEGIRIVG